MTTRLLFAPQAMLAGAGAGHRAARFLAYLVAFVFLDWATFTPALSPLGITPWNPAMGLAVALVIAQGPILAPLLIVGPLVSDLVVKDVRLVWWVTMTEATVTGLIYWAGVTYLLRPALAFDRGLQRFQDLMILGLVMAVCAAIVAIAYNEVLVFTGYMTIDRLGESAFRHWVGDLIGLMVVTPVVLLLAFRPEFPKPSFEIVFQIAAILLAVMIVVGHGSEPKLHLSFLLLLPVMWLAVRFGLEGVLPGLLLVQICVMIALHVRADPVADVTMFQTIMVMLAVSGIAVGQLVSERARTERRLRLQQDAIARAGRISSIGAFATAIAHELNQPLTAASNYARATAQALSGDAPQLEVAGRTAGKLVEQIERSAEVVRRLRSLLQTGRIETAPHSVSRILTDSVEILTPEKGRGVDISVSIQPELPQVDVDLIQVEHVIINLLRNAMEALDESRTVAPKISVHARYTKPDHVEIQVADNGPGFPLSFDTDASGPVVSSKLDGLGIGLSICRSIIEAHGGTLVIERPPRGACVTITLPVSREDRHA
ncbi:MAG TPA: ATP-binding protein [Hyphomicrobiaceae bacterium]|nr:ATP-binding protein [Hyphomicrobiaceae bacterium]